MKCKLGDRVMVIKSEAGNEGRVGVITAAAIPERSLFPGDDWLVVGRFATRSSLGFVYEANVVTFPDSWLMPLRDDGLPESENTDADLRQPVAA